MYVFCIFTVCVCISSLLIFALFYCLHVERYPDCQAVSDRSTLCNCFILLDCLFIMLTIQELHYMFLVMMVLIKKYTIYDNN